MVTITIQLLKEKVERKMIEAVEGLMINSNTIGKQIWYNVSLDRIEGNEENRKNSSLLLLDDGKNNILLWY